MMLFFHFCSKNLGSVMFLFFKEINIFIEKGCITFTKSDNKYIYNVTKDMFFVKNKCCFIYFHHQKKKKSDFLQKLYTAPIFTNKR